MIQLGKKTNTKPSKELNYCSESFVGRPLVSSGYVITTFCGMSVVTVMG